MQTSLAVLTSIGAVALFILGLRQITAAVNNSLGPLVRSRLSRSEVPALSRILTGVLLTAGGSAGSGAVTVVSMVDSGAATAERTPWVLAGINLGATAVCWFIAILGYRVALAPAALVILIIALPLRQHAMFGRYTLSEALAGLALLMIGIDFASGRIDLAPGAPLVPEVFQQFADFPLSPIVAVLVGLLFSAGFRSSTGAVVMTLSLAARGWISLELAAAATLGANLGAPLVFQLSVRELGREARRTALLYLMSAGIATTLGVLSFPLLLQAARLLPISGTAGGTAAKIAFFYSAVHLAGAPLTGLLRTVLLRATEALIKPDNDGAASGERARPALLRLRLPETLDADLTLIQSSLARMADGAHEMMMIVMNVSQIEDDIEEAGERLIQLRSDNQELMDRITHSLTGSSQLPCSTAQAERMWQQQRVAQELGLIGDDCFKAMRLLIRSHTKQLRFHQESHDELFEFSAQVLDFLKYISDYLEGSIERPDPDVAGRMEEGIDKLRNKLKKRARKVLERHEDADVRGELAFIDIIAHLEHVGDHCLTISETVRRLSRTRA